MGKHSYDPTALVVRTLQDALDAQKGGVKCGQHMVGFPPERVEGMISLLRQPITITIRGVFSHSPEEVEELVDQALCDAGLCGCSGPGNGYVLSVDTADTR